MRDALSAFAEHFDGYRDNIHDGIGISVVVSRLDYLNIYLFNYFTVLSGQVFEPVIVESHCAARGNFVFISEFHFCHVESFYYESPYFNVICCHCFYLLILFLEKMGQIALPHLQEIS